MLVLYDTYTFGVLYLFFVFFPVLVKLSLGPFISGFLFWKLNHTFWTLCGFATGLFWDWHTNVLYAVVKTKSLTSFKLDLKVHFNCAVINSTPTEWYPKWDNISYPNRKRINLKRVWTKRNHLEVWSHIKLCGVPPHLLRLDCLNKDRRGVSSSKPVICKTLTAKTALTGFYTKALHQVRQSRLVVNFVPVVKRYSRDHSGTNTQSMCALRGGVGGWEAIFRNPGAYREPWAGVKLPSVFLVHVSFCLAELMLFFTGWAVTLHLNIVGF